MNSIPPLAIPDPVEEANRTFLDERRKLVPQVLAGQPGLKTAEALRTFTDHWICTLWRKALPSEFRDSVSLHATGGYGRNELAIHSDIDILIALHEPALAEQSDFILAIERLMAWTRQTRLSLSHAVRTAEQARYSLDEDRRTAISLLDLRHLQGPPSGARQLSRQFVVDHLRGDDEGRTFVQTLIEGLRRRIARHGQTVFLLEPDVKSGEGGLRDLNCVTWAAHIRWQIDARRESRNDVGWTEKHRTNYCERLDDLLSLRNRLHLLQNRKHDRLTFREQEALVRLSKYEASADPGLALSAFEQACSEAEAPPEVEGARSELSQAIESSMANYYRRARDIATTCERFLRRWTADDRTPQARCGAFEIKGAQLAMADDAAMTDDVVFDALVLAGERDLLLDPRLETRLEEEVALWPIGSKTAPDRAARLRRLLVDPEIAPRTSRRLLELGVLPRIVPEFEPLICHVHHDLYHVYTTDVHSLKCLEKGRAVLDTDPSDHRHPFFCHIAAQIEDTTSFLLSCLFHDIGKNRGGDHSRRGAEMMTEVGPRLGLDEIRTERLAYLVRHHLDLSTTSRRRDISDPEIIEELVTSLGTIEMLNKLTTLTYCDMTTVGPEVMNDWNASLLIELYRRLYEALAAKQTSVFMPRLEHPDQERDQCRQQLADNLFDHPDLDDLRLDQFIDDLPTDHLTSSESDELIRQYATFCRALDADEEIAISSHPLADRGVTEVIISAPDRPGTLARIAGAIASVGVNIMAADIVTTSGRTLDIFHIAHFNPRAVPPALPRPVETQPRLDRIHQRIADFLTKEIDIDSILERRRGEQRLTPRPVPAVATEVRIDDDASTRFTVVEVRTPDRQGLLYSIARTLLDCRVNTRVSRIDSLGHQAIDTFYIQEWDESPLSQERTREVTDALRRTLEELSE